MVNLLQDDLGVKLWNLFHSLWVNGWFQNIFQEQLQLTQTYENISESFHPDRRTDCSPDLETTPLDCMWQFTVQVCVHIESASNRCARTKLNKG